MATALDITDLEMKKRARRAGLFHSAPVRQDAANKDRDCLLINVRKVAKVLRRQYGAIRVVLFGSLAYDAAWWSKASDIDLAVEGLSGKKYWQAWKALEDMLPGKTVDLVDFDMMTGSLKLMIERYGVEL